MSESRIDEQVRNSLGNLRKEPSERVWEGIEKALDSMPVKKNKRRGAFWYYSAAAIFTGLLVFIYLQTCNDSQPATHSALALTSLTSGNNTPSKNFSSDRLNKNSFQNTTVTKESTATSVLKSKTNTSFSKIYSNIHKILIQEKKQISIISDESEQRISKSTKPDNLITTSVITEDRQTDNDAISSERLIKSEDGNVSKTNSTVETENNKIKSELTPSLSAASQSAVYQAEDSQTESSVNSPNSTLGVRRATNLSFDVFGGGVYTFSNKRTNLVYESTSIISKPITNIMTPQLGLNAKYQINNWYITAGLGYSVIGENISYAFNRIGVDTSKSHFNPVLSDVIYDTLGYYDDPQFPGVIFPILGKPHFDTLGYDWFTVKENYTYSQKQKSYNRYKYIDIPVTIGYIWNFNHLQFDASCGVALAFRVGMQGNTVESNKMVAFSNESNPYNSVITSALLGVGAAYQLNSNTKIFIRPSYRINISSVFQNTDNLKVKYNSFALNAGINYTFSR